MSPVENTRQADHPIDPQFTGRWSPRAFTGEEIPVETLSTLLEAARWSPSSYNSQPWRFVWARKGTAHFDTFLSLLTGMNPGWCKDASALLVLASCETMMVPGKSDPVPSYSHSLDAGSGWMAFALQAHLSGWAAHGMVGFNIAQAAETLKIPSGFRVEMMIALGRQGDPSVLEEPLRAREAPSGRKPLAEVAFEGAFPVSS